MTTPRDFALALLSGLGAPLSQNNIDALVSAQAAEGGFMATDAEKTAFYNPLNTTRILNSTTATGYANGAVKIQAYPDWATGLQAIIATLKNGLYKDILASLASSAPAAQTLAVWAKNPYYGWTVVPAVNTAYGSEKFPQGPSSIPLIVPPSTGSTPSAKLVSPTGVATGAVLIYGFWELFKFLGRR